MDKRKDQKRKPPVPDPAAAFAQGQQWGTQPFDAAPGIPGQEVNDPDEQAAAGVHRHRIHPQRRGGGPE